MRSFPARAVLCLPLLLLLVSAAPPAKPPGTRPSPGAAASVQARRAVAAVVERYRSLKGYELQGYAESRFSSSQGQQVNGPGAALPSMAPKQHSGSITVLSTLRLEIRTGRSKKLFG